MTAGLPVIEEAIAPRIANTISARSQAMTVSEALQKTHYILYDYTLVNVRGVGLTLMDLVSAGVVMLVAYLLSRWLQLLLKRRFLPRFNLDVGIELALLRTTHFLVLAFGVYTALSMLNLPLGAVAGFFALLGVGIGFGLQNIASNFISGFILLMERPIKLGDRITVDNVWGDVTQINLRTTVVNTDDNVCIIVPNSSLLDNNLVNWSYGDRRIRIHIPIGVAYGSDVDLVTRLLTRAATENARVLSDPAPAVHFLAFGDSSLNFELLCWLPDSTIKQNLTDELNRAIDRLFRDNNIEIPFPQRDLHVRTIAAPLRWLPQETPGALKS